MYVLAGGLSDRTCEYMHMLLVVNDTKACSTIQHPWHM